MKSQILISIVLLSSYTQAQPNNVNYIAINNNQLQFTHNNVNFNQINIPRQIIQATHHNLFFINVNTNKPKVNTVKNKANTVKPKLKNDAKLNLAINNPTVINQPLLLNDNAFENTFENNTAQQHNNNIELNPEPKINLPAVTPLNNSVTSKGINASFDFNFLKKSKVQSTHKKHLKTKALKNKIQKLNRKLVGKLTLHKKSKYQVDICFLWKK